MATNGHFLDSASDSADEHWLDLAVSPPAMHQIVSLGPSKHDIRLNHKVTSKGALISNFCISRTPAGRAMETALDKRTDRKAHAQGVQVMLHEKQSATLHQLVLVGLSEQWSQICGCWLRCRMICVAFIRQNTMHPDMCICVPLFGVLLAAKIRQIG